MRVLGISAFYHDSAAALIVNGEIVAAAQEERFTRRKHDSSFPASAIRFCLEAGGTDLAGIDEVVFYEHPLRKRHRQIHTNLAYAPAGLGAFKKTIGRLGEGNLSPARAIRQRCHALPGGSDWNSRLSFGEHHLSHAASAFFPSPFEEAAILSIDGVGEWCTTSIWTGKGNEIQLLKEINFPHSLGLLYSAFTSYLGFKVNSGEYKIMGLAPYGRPVYLSRIHRHLVDIRPDGSFWLDQRYFTYCVGHGMTGPRFHALFGAPPRDPEAPLTQRDMDIAASIQAVTEEIVLGIAAHIALETRQRYLCLAGGVALNCVANGKLVRSGLFEDIWIQPASGDAGGALGAALFAARKAGERHENAESCGSDMMQGAFLGPEYSQDEIGTRLQAVGAVSHIYSPEALYERAVDALCAGEAVGWFQGRMEYGPRALGARSILGDARSPDMQSILNRKVKHRESFRPFAAAVMAERADEWFEIDRSSPYMLATFDVRSERRLHSDRDVEREGLERLATVRSTIPAVTHVDYSSRIQTVHRDANRRFWELLAAFERRTGCPALINTSFNVRGEPIVCTPEDAFRCFMGTDIECLVIGDHLLRKEEQTARRETHFYDKFDLD